MESYFAPAERAESQQLDVDIGFVSKSPVMSGLLNSVSGILAVLNEQRQVVALNDAFLKMLGIHDPVKALGLRPGEAVGCVHAREEPGGCGTSRFCSTCGAAVAIVTSLGTGKPAERLCALTARRGTKTVETALLVRSQPLRIQGKRFLLLFLRDVTRQQQHSALARTFFHDINNLLGVVLGNSELLAEEQPSKQADALLLSVLRLTREVAIQRSLLVEQSDDYQPAWHKVTASQVLEELGVIFASHPAARGKKIEFSDSVPGVNFRTDLSLLLRVLCNMIINALEATTRRRPVKVRAESDRDRLTFRVWNREVIPPEVSRRIFQRNFTTKEEPGRGVGTYSMKLFGEEILGGEVGFTSNKKEGTEFWLRLAV